MGLRDPYSPFVLRPDMGFPKPDASLVTAHATSARGSVHEAKAAP